MMVAVSRPQEQEDHQDHEHDRQHQRELHVVDRVADRGRAVVEHDVDAARSARARSWNFGSIALTRSTTSTVLASGWRCTARTIARLPSYQLAVWLFSTESMTVRDIAEAHRVAVAHGDDDVAEGVGVGAAACCAWMVRFWALPSSVPTGVLALAAATAVWISSTPMPRAASASGSSWMRTAYFWLPKICTWPTPSIVDSAGEITCLREGVELRQRRRVALQRQQQDRRIGRVDLAVARRRRHLGRQVPLRARDRRLHVGRRLVDVAVELELDRDRGRALRSSWR